MKDTGVTTVYYVLYLSKLTMIHLEELERNINFYIKILLLFFPPFFFFFFAVIQFNSNSTCFGARVIKTKLNIIMIMLKMKDPLPPSTPLKNNNKLQTE